MDGQFGGEMLQACEVRVNASTCVELGAVKARAKAECGIATPRKGDEHEPWSQRVQSLRPGNSSLNSTHFQSLRTLARG